MNSRDLQAIAELTALDVIDSIEPSTISTPIRMRWVRSLSETDRRAIDAYERAYEAAERKFYDKMYPAQPDTDAPPERS